LTSQVNEMKTIMNFFLYKNYYGELSRDFTMFQTSPVVFKYWFN